MTCAPVAYNSCTVSFRDPLTTDGRLMADVELYEYGALREFCDGDDCNNLDQGVGICLLGVDQSGGDDPPTCTGASYQNPLRISSDNCLWIAIAPPSSKRCTEADDQSQVVDATSTGSTSLGSETCVDLTHESGCDTARFRRSITILGAEAGAPGDGGQVRLFAVIDGERIPIAAACGSGCAVYSGTISLPPQDLEAGESTSLCVSIEAEVISAGTETQVTVKRGKLIVCGEIEYPPPGGFADEEVC